MLRALRLLPLALAAWGASAAEPPLVTDVRVEADARTRARLQPYVTLQAGQPLDAGAVAQSVRLIFAAGDFDDVRVETEATPAGVAVVFRPVPAPLMAELRVLGDRVLSEKELRAVTRLRPDEPLWEARLDEAARDVALALAARGYLEARVSARAGPGERGTAAFFEVSSGPLAQVDEVAVLGAPGEALEVLRQQARPRPGQAWQRARAEKAAAAMQRELQLRGYWRAEVVAEEAYDPQASRVKLRFVVAPGQRMELQLRGSRVPGELRRAAERIAREGGAREDALEQALDSLDQGLRERGHRDVRISRGEEPGPARVALVYQVEAGEAAQVLSVRVLGIDELSPLPPLRTRVAAPLREDVLERDVALLAQEARELGFSEAQAESEVPEGSGGLPVVFRVRPGPRTYVSLVELLAPGEPAVETKPLLTRAGEPYRVRTVALDKAALLAAWREQGFELATVEPEIELSDDKGKAEVRFRVTPGARMRTGEVVISGLERSREQVVRRALGLARGDPFSQSRVLDAERRLQALGIFDRVEARALEADFGEARPVVFDLVEAPRASIAYGLGYAEHDLLRGSVEVTLRNLYGLNRSLSSLARISFRGSRLVATYREPRFFSREQDLLVTAFREEQDRDGFDYVRYGGAMQTARELLPKLTLIARLTYQRTEVFNVTVPIEEIDRQFRTSTFAGPSASLVYDTRDDAFDPRLGRFVGADLALSHGVLGGDSFAKGFLQAASYSPLGSRLVLALSLRAGVSGTFRNEPPRLPLPERFFAGGDYTMRGFAVDAVSPEGGNGLLVGGAELRYSPRPRLELAAFSDVGNVYPLVGDMTLGDLRYTAGLGLRYKSSIGPLRVDWGYKLNRRPGEDAYRIHVTVGHAF